MHFSPRFRSAAPRALAVLALTALDACRPAPTQPKRPPVPVTVAPTARADVPFLVTANGVVEPLQSAAVQAQVSGIITKVTFHEGDVVRSGQTLFQIDPRPYQATLDQARAALARDRATAAANLKDAERYASLVSEGVVTQQQADQSGATAQAAQASVKADEAAVETAQLNLAYTTVRAPIGGRTGQLLVKEGNLVSAAATQRLVVINQVEPVLVRFAVPGASLARIQRFGTQGGLPVTIVPGAQVTAAPSPMGPTPASATDAQAPAAQSSVALTSQSGAVTPPITGKLSFIDNAIDTTTGTVLLKATVPNATGALWPGQFVSASLRLFVEDSALVIPAQAVMTGQQGTYVYVVAQGDSARQRPVTVARTSGSVAVIASGLKDGERVVTDGQSRLTPGAVVTLRTGAESPRKR
jgi:multidrug efflux system membrane fusion protein